MHLSGWKELLSPWACGYIRLQHENKIIIVCADAYCICSNVIDGT